MLVGQLYYDTDGRPRRYKSTSYDPDLVRSSAESLSHGQGVLLFGRPPFLLDRGPHFRASTIAISTPPHNGAKPRKPVIRADPTSRDSYLGAQQDIIIRGTVKKLRNFSTNSQ